MCEFESEFYDSLAIQNSYNGIDIINLLSIDDVERFLRSLGVSEIVNKGEYLICPTICHNALEDAENLKLYYYDENKKFHCYTQCSENFNIIELYRRYMHLNHYDVSYQDAVEYLIQFLQNVATVPAAEKEEKPTSKPEKQIDFIKLKEYNSCALSCFTKFYHPLWERDLIGREAMDKFNILFSLQQNKIIIPHYDIDGRLVGIRARAIEPEDIAIGKYMPIRIGNNIYAHQLGFTLYGLNEHKEAIKKTKRAVIFESEKSVLLGETFYGKYSTAVATCGSQLNRFQINLLVKKLGVTDIILAFDKEYTSLNDPKCKIYRQKLIDKCKKYAGLANFYYLFDEHNLLNEKDSPIDKGRDIYEKLVERKIRIE